MAPASVLSRNEFKPTDDVLLQLFLYNKVHGKPLPENVTILEYDLYGEQNPWEIWEQFGDSNSYGGKDLYFFTTLKRKSGPCARSVRTIGLGSWEGEDVGKIIVATNDPHNKPLGIRKRYRFEKSGTGQDGRWIMHEYILDSSLVPDSSANNQVLCRFRKNLAHNIKPKKSRKKSTSQEERKTRVNTKKRKITVLGLPATTESHTIDNNNEVSLGNDSCQELKGHPESGDNTMDIINGDNNVSLGKDICQETTSHQEKENGGKNEVVENTKGNESAFEDHVDEDGDLTMSWPELFALQLRTGSWFPSQEQIQTLSNTIYKD
ncbi:NAC domain-containing protein 83-like [Lotus japonicus]|uniref:NAC domain-containing protein 83-like n=1 Tax=Lotus japonicus TaxID=34305 RepID=UPI0025860391|nr:NAC domain-containing protein 83-like [Lotus japonicus]